MRNSRGEWTPRVGYDRDDYYFIRRSGAQPKDFVDDRADKLDRIVLWTAFIGGLIVYAGYFFFGWATL
jgi:hypothetical protein